MKQLKAVVFDVDGTLLKAVSSWKFFHEKLGTWEKGKHYAEQFFQGLITYDDWARFDASLWRNKKLERVKQIVSDIPYTVGARHTIATLREHDFKVILLSAGLSPVIERVKKEIVVDDSLANELKVKNGLLTGDVETNVSFDNKDVILVNMLKKFNLRVEECAAIGDDETMIPLFEKVTLSIAFNPRSRAVEEKADIVIKSDDLRKVLPHLLSK